MRSFLAACAALALAVAVPALAVEPTVTDEPYTGIGGGFSGRSNDCPGIVEWDSGMYDDFTPPTGCASAGSAGCFVLATNEGGFPADGRRVADDFISHDGWPITHVKIWGRYNQAGYDYHLTTPNSLHGFCVKFYLPREHPIWCPDGTVPGEDAIGDIVYEEYVPFTDVTEYELPPPALARSYNYCIELPNAFFPDIYQAYWVSVSADFDFTSAGTQWFWRLFGEGVGYYPYCEAGWWDTWGTEVPWNAISVGAGQPCWAGWDMAFVLYSDYVVPTKVCCVGQDCFVITEYECTAMMGGVFHPEWSSCGPPNPCEATPTTPSTWGGIKNLYR
jgi:hypothetical protein